MTQMLVPVGLEKDDSNSIYQPQLMIQPYPIEGIFSEADAAGKVLIVYPFPRIQPLEVKGENFLIFVLPQTDGSTLTRITKNRFSATGQGETEEEALQDITSAIELLMEEESNPSGDVPWPENYQ